MRSAKGKLKETLRLKRSGCRYASFLSIWQSSCAFSETRRRSSLTRPVREKIVEGLGLWVAGDKGEEMEQERGEEEET